MSTRQKILLVDDDPQVLETFKALLGQLRSQPEVHTANSGARAMALLQEERFWLLICDLMMPKMDGLQVLSIVRRKHPQLRTMALTGLVDEEFRARAYALGVDLYWHKPETQEEIKMFLECVESLLDQDADTGFRGIQSKSLVDLIQMECMSQSSSVLRITNGSNMGKIWVQDGEVVDAESEELRGEPAFQKIFTWPAGSFEVMGAEPSRPRTIFKSYSGLLLESAQVLDEARSASPVPVAHPTSPLARLAQIEGVEFVLATRDGLGPMTRGLENPDRMNDWTRDMLQRFIGLGEQLHAGEFAQLECRGVRRHVVLTRQNETNFCVGWKNSLGWDTIRDSMKKLLVLWGS